LRERGASRFEEKMTFCPEGWKNGPKLAAPLSVRRRTLPPSASAT